MDNRMKKCSWEKIEKFNSPMEFKRFIRWIEGQKNKGLCNEITDQDVQAKNVERKFVYNTSNEVWILAFPDLLIGSCLLLLKVKQIQG